MRVIAILCACAVLWTAEPSAEPILRIETGFHAADVMGVAASADGRTVVSVGNDKTVRVWRWDGQQLAAEAVYRVPIGTSDEGRLYAVAISPDGRWLVAGGWTGWEWDQVNSVYVIDRRSGQLARRLTGFPGEIRRLRISPAGDALLVGMGGGAGVSCLGLLDGQERWRDADYGAASDGACWLPDGGCVTTCLDGRIRRYDATGRLVASSEAPQGKQPNGIDHQGGVLAVGYDDATAISLLRADTLAPVAGEAGLDASGMDEGVLSSVCAAHGRWWGGGTAGIPNQTQVFSWPAGVAEDEEEEERQGHVVFEGAIVGLCRLPAGIVVGSNAPSLGILSAAGESLAKLESRTWGFSGELLAEASGRRVFSEDGLLLDLASGAMTQLDRRQQLWLAHLAQPGDPTAANSLAWDLVLNPPRDPTTAEELARAALAMPEGDHPYNRDTLAEALLQLNRFAEAHVEQERVIQASKAQDPPVDADTIAAFTARLERIAAAKLTATPAAIPPRLAPPGDRFTRPTTTAPGLDVQELNSVPTFNGKPVELGPGENSRACAIPPSGQLVVLACDWSLRALALDGTEIWKQDVPHMAWRVNCPAKAPVAIVTYDDGTVRWHRLSDGVEVLACFVHQDGRRWVAWTPSGYYWAGSGGEELIGWHINRGRDQLADFYPASRFRDRFNRPDIVQAVCETWDEAKAIALVSQTRRVEATVLAATLPPVVEILTPAEGERITTSQVTLTLRLRSAADAPVTGLRVLYNGQELPLERGLRPLAAAADTTLTITLPPQSGVLAVVADNRHGASVPALRQLTWGGASLVVKPACYVLAVGVGAYRNPAITGLRFPGADARAVAAAFKGQEGRLFREVQAQVVTDGDRLAVMKGMTWLKKNCTNQDLAVLFLAGHGENDDMGAYHFLPADTDPEDLASTAVPFTAIISVIQGLPGKRLAFLDTCRAGNVTGGLRRRAVGNATDQALNALASAENGCVVFAAATGKQAALEQDAWGHGAFTLALTEAVNGTAPTEAGPLLRQILAEPTMSVNLLNTYIAERVKQLTNGQQSPTMERPATVPDFPVAVRP